MIFDAIVGVLLGLFSAVLALIPSYSLPDSLTDSGAGIGAAVGSVNNIFPVTVLGACIGVMVGVKVFLMAWAALVWLYDKIPFKAS